MTTSANRDRLRLAVDVHSFSRIHQGTRTFIENIYRQLPHVDPNIDVISFGERQPPEFPIARHVAIDLSSAGKRLTYGSWAALREVAPHYVHYQFFCPIIPVGRSIVTVHDILPLTHPEFFKPSFRHRFRLMLGAAVRTASMLTAVSEFTRESVACHYGVPREDIVIVPNAVSTDLYQSMSRDEATAFVKKSFGLDSYVVSISRIEKRKNIPLLIEATRMLNASGFPHLKVVLVGGLDETAGSGCQASAQAISVGEVVHLPGLSDNDKAMVLRGAEMLVFPSLAEGFGIPPLEAMAAGVPAIVAERTAHGRIYSGAALMIEGTSAGELADQMRRLLTNASLRAEMVKRGGMLAHEMNWRKSAATLVDGIRRHAMRAGRAFALAGTAPATTRDGA